MDHRFLISSISSALALPTGHLCSRTDVAGRGSCWTAGPYHPSSLARAASQSESVTRREEPAHQPARPLAKLEMSPAHPALLKAQFRFRLLRAAIQLTLEFQDPASP